jgi:thiol-disulfide isomerase/thioredoxin
MKLTRRAALSGLAALAFGRAGATPAVPPAVSLAQEVALPRDALPLRMKDADGQSVSLSDHAGQLVVLALWGSWCPPCRREMPSFAALAARAQGHNIAVVPLAFERSGAARVRRFYEETGISNLPILLGDGENLFATLGLEKLPTTAIIDGTGRHILTVAGEATWDDDETFAWLSTLAG